MWTRKNSVFGHFSCSACNEVADSQVLILIKMEILHWLCLLFRNTYFKECILMAASTIYFLSYLSRLTQNVFKWVNEIVGLLRKFQKCLRNSLVTIYKLFLPPHLDYNDIICDQGNNFCFHQELELFQHNAALSIKGAIRGTSE